MRKLGRREKRLVAERREAENKQREAEDKAVRLGQELGEVQAARDVYAGQATDNLRTYAAASNKVSELNVRVRLAEEKVDKITHEVLGILKAAVTSVPKVTAITPATEVHHVREGKE
jgi:hypothetical protein